ncbi:hypothetical protein FQA39_LY17618 [Lamprigera yunnana]|nr:hypothetical protein FQA39_LY17618 [Lamprigera yunnana]
MVIFSKSETHKMADLGHRSLWHYVPLSSASSIPLMRTASEQFIRIASGAMLPKKKALAEPLGSQATHRPTMKSEAIPSTSRTPTEAERPSQPASLQPAVKDTAPKPSKLLSGAKPVPGTLQRPRVKSDNTASAGVDTSLRLVLPASSGNVAQLRGTSVVFAKCVSLLLRERASTNAGLILMNTGRGWKLSSPPPESEVMASIAAAEAGCVRER